LDHHKPASSHRRLTDPACNRNRKRDRTSQSRRGYPGADQGERASARAKRADFDHCGQRDQDRNGAERGDHRQCDEPPPLADAETDLEQDHVATRVAAGASMSAAASRHRRFDRTRRDSSRRPPAQG
jgi:hypothetical protein